MPAPSWTDPEIEHLKHLWAEGHTAGEIARRLGRTSRNSVIGKVHRLGLSGRPVPLGLRKAKEKPQPEPKPGPLFRRWLGAERKIRPPAAIVLRPSGEPVPRGLTIVQLGAGTCRWPHGDGAHVRYCGHQSEAQRSYCLWHWQRAHTQARRAG